MSDDAKARGRGEYKGKNALLITNVEVVSAESEVAGDDVNSVGEKK